MLKKKLENIPLFASLADDELAALAEISEIKKYNQGEAVFAEGDKGKDIFFLVSGEVSIRKKISSGFKTIAVLREGDLFGEMSFFENAPRSADALASDDCDILGINGAEFESFLSDKPRKSFSILMKMLAISSARLRNMDRYFTTLYQTARIMSSCSSVEELAEKILPEIIDSLPVSGAALYMYSVFDGEYNLAAAVSAEAAQTVSSGSSFMEKLSAGKNICDANVPDLPGLRFFSPIEDGNGLIGFIGIAAANDPAAEDRILIGTVCNMISPVIVNLRTKQEELMKDRLKNKKWQL
ncbi:MAG: cyclic nucleotide-binding domain-containing protein [Elusimicrobiota bacterium]|nr:cyclic nucleotide-binding domain-containing protein [Elusimicrobiota bacterium]